MKSAKKDNRRFGRSGAYKCSDCGKLTRETGGGESALMMCKTCHEAGGAINSYYDGYTDEATLIEYLSKLGYTGGY